MAASQHKAIEASLMDTRKQSAQISKILILGSGSVGKSAVFKSIRRIHKGPICEDEMIESKAVIRANLITAILTLCKKSQELYESYDENCDYEVKHGKKNIVHGYKSYADPDLLKCVVDMDDDDTVKDIQNIVNYGQDQFIEAKKDDPSYPLLDYEAMKELASSIDRIWRLPAIQKTFELRLKRYYSLFENMRYFFDKVHECMSQDYMPTEEDIWRLKVRTTGVIHSSYETKDDWHFTVTDVGGERNERRKWIHSFEAVTCIIFVASLKQYCESLFEDEQQIGLLENLALFNEIANSRWFKKTEIVLLLNHTDRFRENLTITPLTFCFGDEYKGRNYNDYNGLSASDDDTQVVFRCMSRILLLVMKNDQLVIPVDIVTIMMRYCEFNEWWLDLCYKDGIEFIKKKYLAIPKGHHALLIREVCAIIPEEIEKIMTDVQHKVLRSNLKRGGLV